MPTTCLKRLAYAFVVLLLGLATGARAFADGNETPAGTVVYNRAEATYSDANGNGFSTVSPTVTLTIQAVSAVNVTPDETEPSNTVAPNERIERLFRICNTGNTPDFYTITRAEVSAPATLVALYFDIDGSGTLTEGDRQVRVGEGMSQRVARGACIGLIAVVETNAVAQNSRLNISITARSNVAGSVGGLGEDTGTIVNAVGSGARLTAPHDSHLPPVKFVENSPRTTAAQGQTLHYQIAFRNSGDVTARNVVLEDELPQGLDYIRGSLRLHTRALTDVPDSDEGTVTGQRIVVRLNEVKVDELVQIEFQARVRMNVAPGVGLVNSATVRADNAAAVTSSQAVAVVNPYGLVYEGRSGGGATISGARVSLLRDSTVGELLQFADRHGTSPNEQNDNPFRTDGQGRWNFILAPEQIGTPASPARYFLNVTASGYRARMLEILVAPVASASSVSAALFTLTVRAVDGQPIAQSGGFELTEETVTVENLAAFALNVPVFENSSLEVTKTADRSTAEIGDVVTYRVEVHNSTAATLDEVVVRDRLPESFHYAQGSARIENPPAPVRSTEPEATGGELVFRVGRMQAGARLSLIYRVRVGANAREGEQINSAVVSGLFPSTGERITSSPARASVRIRKGVFSTQQIIVGRVFEDANGNGLFDGGEKPVAGVRLYLNNGQSVVTDSAGQYNFPSVNDGAVVIALDPVTLPTGYALANSGRREGQSWTRLLRTPLGGGSLLRQNFALRPPTNGSAGDDATAAPANSLFSNAKTNLQPSQETRSASNGPRTDENSARAGEKNARVDEKNARLDEKSARVDVNGIRSDAISDSASGNGVPSHGNSISSNGNTVPARGNNIPSNGNDVPSRGNGVPSRGNGGSSNGSGLSSNGNGVQLASGTYEMTATERVEPIDPGAVRIISPAPNEVVGGAALEIEARVAEGWTVALDVEGTRVPDSRIGMRRVDRASRVTSFTFVGINLRPGPNRIRATAVSPEGAAAMSAEVVAYGRGPAKRLEIVADKSQLSAGGRDSTHLRVRAFDEWGHPAADGAVALEVTAGRLRREGGDDAQASEAKGNEAGSLGSLQPNGAGNGQMNGAGSSQMNGADSAQLNGLQGLNGEQSALEATQQIISLKDGEGVALFVADNTVGTSELRASTGKIEARAQVQITPELRPSILVGLAEVSVGAAAPEMALRHENGNSTSRVAFFYRGQLFGRNLLTLAYDSARPLNRTAGRDRLFQLDPLERVYPLFGDSSTRYEDAQSNSKLYARLDRGRSFLMFGDFETEHRNLALAGYSRKLTGVKAHVENSKGDYISVTGARPDTAFARDVFGGGGLGLIRLSHGEILPGSEQVTIEVRDRRNPEVIISREQLIRSIDYNLDPQLGEIFFLRPITAFDYALNLVQVVVSYEHRSNDMSSAVYTGRAVKNFEGAGLRLGLSVVDQRQGEDGSFVLGGLDGEKRLPRGGSLQFEYATSRGQVAFNGNLFGAESDGRHNGSAYRVELTQPLGYKETTVRASFARAGANFLNPFGATVTPGSQRTHVSVDFRPRSRSLFSFGVTDERNRTANVNNRRLTGSLNWAETWSDRVRTTLGYDARRYSDDLTGNQTNSNLVTAGLEWQPTEKLQLSVKREQNLGDADPTYPNQTTLQANYQWNQWARLFFTQRLGSAAIVPISDTAATGFASSSARRETAIGIETRLWRNTNFVSRYQLENGINGTDSFAVVGLNNRLPLRDNLSLELGYERGFHLAGEGESFNSATVGFSWLATKDFRASGRYDLRDHLGLTHVLTLATAGRLMDNLTAIARLQISEASYESRDNSSLNANVALAWRPLHNDRFGWLFSYTRRDLYQDGARQSMGAFATSGATRDRADILSTDAYYQATRNLELYGRFALKFGRSGSPDLADVSSLTYMTQGRAVYRLGRFVDVAGEARMLFQPSSRTRRASYGAELGFWVLPDLRLGGGYNFTGASEPTGNLVSQGRRGFYFNISSKLSNLFDLFGTGWDAQQQQTGQQQGGQQQNVKSGDEGKPQN